MLERKKTILSSFDVFFCIEYPVLCIYVRVTIWEGYMGGIHGRDTWEGYMGGINGRDTWEAFSFFLASNLSCPFGPNSFRIYSSFFFFQSEGNVRFFISFFFKWLSSKFAVKVFFDARNSSGRPKGDNDASCSRADSAASKGRRAYIFSFLFFE